MSSGDLERALAGGVALPDGSSYHRFTHPHRGKKPHIGAAKHDVWIVDGEHRGVVGQAEYEPAMHQPLLVSSHGGSSGELGSGATVGELNHLAAQRAVDT